MLNLNDVYEVQIEEMNIFANGVCHIDSMVVFVFGAITGEKCKIKITKVFPRYAYANVVEVLEPSLSRVHPACSCFDRCGGCSFLHTSMQTENETKLNFVKSVFAKNKIEADFAQIDCPICEKYRNKVVLFYNNGSFGYNEKSTINVIDHENCLLNDSVFDEIARFTAKSIGNSNLRALYIRKGKGIMVCPVFYKSTDVIKYATELINAFPSVEAVLNGTLKDKDFALEKVSFKTVYGLGYIYDTICSLDFKISPKSFYQVNKACAESLYEKAIELLNPNQSSVIADLFCGTGTMGIIAARRTGVKVYGVEIEPDAVKDARHNAKINNVSNIEFYAMDASKFDKKIDACIIDPPRKGCSEFMISTLLRIKPRRIVYVSCNPDTMCKDIKALLGEYTISSNVFTYNMFPKTTHVESVVQLTKK